MHQLAVRGAFGVGELLGRRVPDSVETNEGRWVGQAVLPGDGVMPIRTINDIEELKSRVGQEIAVGDWVEIAQERIDRFAEATEDRQWIHIDPERCARESPFGTTVAHGFLTLSLVPWLTSTALRFDRAPKLSINYGLDRVRFPAPLPAGADVRCRMELQAIEPIDGGWQLKWKITIEAQGIKKPVCVAETIGRIIES